ncbi:MAG: hypothetical protein HYV27_24005 [Candidatus Hydrogenedentes bacterium]|nr:hypothetical protein [Candidatus Hydrogenedentota bacterium]
MNLKEEYSVMLFLHSTVVLVGLLLVCGLPGAPDLAEAIGRNWDGTRSNWRILPFVIPAPNLFRAVCFAVPVVAVTLLFDTWHGEGVAAILLITQTLPLAMMLLITVVAYRVGAVSVFLLFVALFALLLLYVQFTLYWVMGILLFGAIPAAFVWTYVILEKISAVIRSAGVAMRCDSFTG